MIKAVIFDWGGVLIEHPTKPMLKYIAGYFNIPEKQMSEIYSKLRDEFNIKFQKGLIEEKEIWNKICSEYNLQIPKTDSLWAEALTAAYKEKKEMLSLARILKQRGCKTAVLSNTEIGAVNYFLTKNYDMFDELIFSCVEHLMKPEKEIYEIALRKLNVKPNEAAFIDDNKENVEAFNKIGGYGIFFESSAEVRKELFKLSVNPY